MNYAIRLKVLLSTVLSCATILLSTAQTQVGNTVLGSAPDDRMGTALAISDDAQVMISGLWGTAVGSFTQAGTVRVFEFLGGSWQQLGQNLDGDTTNRRFGYSVEVSDDGSRIAIGARGFARVYDLISGTWQQVGADLEFPLPGLYGSMNTLRFADNADILAVGGRSDTVSVEVYELISGAWTRMGASFYEPLNHNIALSGDGQRLVTQWDDWPLYQLVVFDYDGTDWNQVGDTIAATMINAYSDAMDISNDGSRIVAVLDNDTNNFGTVMTHDLIGGQWTQTLSPYPVHIANRFGACLKLSDDGNTFVFGTADDSWTNDSTYVIVCTSNGTQWNMAGMVIDGSAHDETANGHVDITGDGTHIVWGGNDPVNAGLGGFTVLDYSSIVSVNETLPLSIVNVFPNPSTASIHISAPHTLWLRYEIVDMHGRQLRASSLAFDRSISVRSLASGQYLLRLYSEDGLVSALQISKI